MIARNKLKSYLSKVPSEDLINILCENNVEIIGKSFTNILLKIKKEYPLDPAVRTGISILNNKKSFIIGKLIELRSNPRIQSFLVTKCPTLLKSRSLKRDELINAVIAKNRATTFTRSGLRVYNELNKLRNQPIVVNNMELIEEPQINESLKNKFNAPNMGGRRKTYRKHKKTRSTRKYRRV